MDNSDKGKYMNYSMNAFFKPSEVAPLFIVWGLKEQDLSSCALTNFTCDGVNRWDKEFNMNVDQVQTDLLVSKIYINIFCYDLSTVQIKGFGLSYTWSTQINAQMYL